MENDAESWVRFLIRGIGFFLFVSGIDFHYMKLNFSIPI